MSGLAAPPRDADQAAITEWIRDGRRRGLRPRTLGGRRKTLGGVSRFLPNGLMAATEDELGGWEDHVLDRIAAATRINYVVAIRAFFRWAVDAGRLKVDPSPQLSKPKAQPRLPKPLPSREAMQRAASLPGSRDRLAVMLALAAGLRCCEIADLRPTDCVTTDAGPALHVRDGKGGKERVVPIPRWLAIEVASYGGTHWVVPAMDGGRLSASGVQCLGRRALANAGLPPSMHRLRHTYATALYAASGKDIRLVQSALGHSSPAVTAVYAAWAAEDAVASVEALPRPEVRPAEAASP